jgi:hypothetical protein
MEKGPTLLIPATGTGKIFMAATIKLREIRQFHVRIANT